MTAPPEETRAQPVEVTCPGCFHPREWDAAGVCPICHYRANAEGRSAALLPVGTQLKGYVIGEKLGQGGFGITYRGFDVTLKMKVAIKEYYPSEFVGRSTDRKTVVLNSRDHEELFHYGLRTFLQEAQTIAQLRHPHLVRVVNFFELNDTAYLVMDYYEGEDLARHLKPPRAGQPGVQLPWRRVVALLLPVLDGLQKVHQAGFMHRDIKPGNLYLTRDDELILLDFGSARQVSGTHSRSLLIYSEGFAPYEQYLQDHLNRQGPWTDVYAVAATLHFMLTGHRVSSALDRKQATLLQQPDVLKPARHFVPDLPLTLDAALLRALAVEPEQRLQSVAELKQYLETALAEEDKPRPQQQPQVASKSPISPEPSHAPRLEPSPVPRTQSPIAAIPRSESHPRPEPQPAVMLAPPLLTEPKSPRGLRGLLRLFFGTTAPAPVPKRPALQVFQDMLSDGTRGPAMVVIPAGKFWMGSPESEAERRDNERRHRVSVEAFAMGQYEVTFVEYDHFCTATGRNKPNDEGWGRGDRPVIRVSWHDAVAYTKWLSKQTGQDYRLPTEAEWEYAARAGTETPFWTGRCVTTAQANYDGTCSYGTPDCGARTGDYRRKTTPVGSFAPNSWKLHDTVGNVWEWTCSVFDENYGGAERKCAKSDTSGPLAVRGGSWYDDPAGVRSANRRWGDPGDRVSGLGFRLARSL